MNINDTTRQEAGTMMLPKMDGREIREGVTLIGEPTPMVGTDKLRCLANVMGCLCVVELGIKFKEAQSPEHNGRPVESSR